MNLWIPESLQLDSRELRSVYALARRMKEERFVAMGVSAYDEITLMISAWRLFEVEENLEMLRIDEPISRPFPEGAEDFLVDLIRIGVNRAAIKHGAKSIEPAQELPTWETAMPQSGEYAEIAKENST